MKAPREYKRWVAMLRKRNGKKNGSIGFVDDPGMENLLANSKKNYKRKPKFNGV